VYDRVCQQALVNRLEPIFEKVFDPSSFGYRKGRKTADALASAAAARLARRRRRHERGQGRAAVGKSVAAQQLLSMTKERLN
jgi:hypothetical protein